MPSKRTPKEEEPDASDDDLVEADDRLIAMAESLRKSQTAEAAVKANAKPAAPSASKAKPAAPMECNWCSMLLSATGAVCRDCVRLQWFDL